MATLLSPILAGRGVALAVLAPAALTATFVTSIVGALTYAVLAITTAGPDIAPEWLLGFACGLGGLCGGHLGAHLQPRVPDTALRTALGALAVLTAVFYAVQVLG
ncbi:TSUP family transporter [Nocardia puris]|uniref:Sulfite exporter TauE/SafE n=1 Tax=Nocardia puris TaxID=208602 RepID=A0A366E247_9NOCA|nr:TSUP family transporter [Nocardia puris]RBO96441.1 sulfite exporter TauE/SafE [Nocardia puris]